MDRYNLYFQMLISKNPSLEYFIDKDLIKTCNSFIEINSIVKNCLIENNINLNQLTTVSLNDLNFVLKLNNMQIKN